MKKRTIAIIMTLAMVLTLLTGCAATEPEPAPAEPTDEIEIIDYDPIEVVVEPIQPTPIPEPETVSGVSLANGLKIMYKSLNRGDTVKIVGEDGEYWLIEDGEDFRGDPATLLVEKKYIKTEKAEYEPRTVYCVANAPVYTSALCREDQILLNCVKNSEVTVVDEIDGIVYIEWTETTEENGTITKHGYMSASDVSDTYIKDPVWYGGGGGGNGGGGGGAPDAGYDGGDIAAGDLLSAEIHGGNGGGATAFLAPVKHFTVRRMTDVKKTEPAEEDTEEEKVTEGVCFSDEVPVYAGVLKYGDEVRVIEEVRNTSEPVQMFAYSINENGDLSFEESSVDQVKVFLNGCICHVPECVVRMPDDEPFEQWEGYIQKDVIGYSEFDLADEGTEIPVNSVVTVVDQILGILIVKDGDNVYYFTPNSIKTEEYVAPYVDWSWYGGGEVIQEWTDPVL